ncbi:12352_t:CDS:2 [Ambispora gerdemannii]|uniref:12352_t:CDS:1 n=1 Tax=Ambispora gerdemannii TaxID=144530 RepID=A0A9N9C807_9GLOM|nr:12352_t:CDS:2 [Ambispora gerdemannii]
MTNYNNSNNNNKFINQLLAVIFLIFVFMSTNNNKNNNIYFVDASFTTTTIAGSNPTSHKTIIETLFLKNIILPTLSTLLIVATFSLFASQQQAEKEYEKQERHQQQHNNSNIRQGHKPTTNNFISSTLTKIQERKELGQREQIQQELEQEITFQLGVYLKLAELVQFGQAGLRSIDEQREGESLIIIDEEIIKISEISSIDNQGKSALRRSTADFYKHEDHLDDIGTDLEFLGFMNQVTAELGKYSNSDDDSIFFAFLVTAFFYIVRIILVCFILFSSTFTTPYSNNSLSLFSSLIKVSLLYIIHVGVLRLLDYFKVPILSSSSTHT